MALTPVRYSMGEDNMVDGVEIRSVCTKIKMTEEIRNKECKIRNKEVAA